MKNNEKSGMRNGGRFFLKELKQQFESRFDPPHKQTTVTIVWGGSQSNNNDIKFTDNK